MWGRGKAQGSARGGVILEPLGPKASFCTCHHTANILAMSQELTLISPLQNATL